jgi:regulator of RNase E activity RraA
MHSKDELLGLIPEDRIRMKDFPRPAEDVVQSFLQLKDMGGLVSRAMDRLGIVGSIAAHDLPPLVAGKRIVGPAATVRNVPARIAPWYGWQKGVDTRLGEREAYYVAQPGDVIVIDSGGRMIASNMGPNSAAMAKSRGIVGAVVDGPVTGVAGIRGEDFPLWCRGGTTITGHHRVETIEINGTVSCGNVQVAPGDLVVADDSGVSIIPCDRISEVLDLCLGLAEKGRALATAISEGARVGEIRQVFKKLVVDEEKW